MENVDRNDANKARAAAKALDRRHWAARIRVSLEELRNSAFRREYPFESHIHDLSGLNYHYVDEGEGEPVVMVHGNPTWSYFYRGLVKRLASRHRCLAPDHIGCGLSEKPKNYRYTLEQHILNLESWLEAMLPQPSWPGGRINLVVHDWGGPIGIGYAIRHPERIKRVVVLNTSAFTSGSMPLGIRICRWPVLGPLLVRGANLFAAEAAESCTVKKMPRKIRKDYVMPYNSWGNRVAVLSFVRDIPFGPGTRTYDILRQIEDGAADLLKRIPLLVQWGMRDWCFTPAFLDMWKKRFPLAEIDEYQAGHYLLEDAGAAIFPRIERFLEGAAP